jgi:hypothetical protein
MDLKLKYGCIIREMRGEIGFLMGGSIFYGHSALFAQLKWILHVKQGKCMDFCTK